jgi:hypothetical protein
VGSAVIVAVGSNIGASSVAGRAEAGASGREVDGIVPPQAETTSMAVTSRQKALNPDFLDDISFSSIFQAWRNCGEKLICGSGYLVHRSVSLYVTIYNVTVLKKDRRI